MCCVTCSASAQDEPRGVAPSAEATEALEHINRLRADPSREAFEIASLSRRTFDIPDYVEMDMFIDELLAVQAAPPLVFDPLLIEAAENHSRYMIAHGQGHSEDPAHPEFTGAMHAQRIAATGYAAWVSGENVFIAGLNAHQSHVGFVIDWGWEDNPGGMQPGRGHRANLLLPAYTEIGVAALPWHEEEFGRDLWSVSHALAAPRPARRCVGGVVYTDRNSNGRFDAGEGRGGVELVGDDGSRATTWESGAYTLVLSGDRATAVTASDGVLRMRFEVPAGQANVKRDWVLPSRIDPDAVRRAVQACQAIEADNESLRRRAQAALWLVTQDYAVPEDLADDVAALTEGLAEEVAASKRRVLDALLDITVPDDADPVRDLIHRERRNYQQTALGDWFAQAETVRRVWAVAVRRADDLGPHGDPAVRRRTLRTLYRQLRSVDDPVLRAHLVPVLRP